MARIWESCGCCWRWPEQCPCWHFVLLEPQWGTCAGDQRSWCHFPNIVEIGSSYFPEVQPPWAWTFSWNRSRTWNAAYKPFFTQETGLKLVVVDVSNGLCYSLALCLYCEREREVYNASCFCVISVEWKLGYFSRMASGQSENMFSCKLICKEGKTVYIPYSFL